MCETRWLQGENFFTTGRVNRGAAWNKQFSPRQVATIGTYMESPDPGNYHTWTNMI